MGDCDANCADSLTMYAPSTSEPPPKTNQLSDRAETGSVTSWLPKQSERPVSQNNCQAPVPRHAFHNQPEISRPKLSRKCAKPAGGCDASAQTARQRILCFLQIPNRSFGLHIRTTALVAHHFAYNLGVTSKKHRLVSPSVRRGQNGLANSFILVSRTHMRTGHRKTSRPR